MGKLRQYIIDNIPTDIEIILFDPNDTIKIQSHKCILGCYFDYFHSLFNFDKGKNRPLVEIEVSNAKAARDLILSLNKQKINYGCHGVTYLLEMFKCRRFFCLKNDVRLLYDIKILPEDFNLLMDVMDEFDFINDKYLMRTIKKNIPLDYDLGNFSLEFINELLHFNDYLIVSGGSDHCIKIWDAETGQLLNTLCGHTHSVLSVAFSPDNLRIVSGGIDNSIKIWDVHSGQLSNTLNGHTDWVRSVAFSPDNLRIASGSIDHSTKIWDSQTGQLLNTLNDHADRVQNVAFSPDGLKIASGGYDGIITWNVHNGQLLRIMKGHLNTVSCIAFSPDNMKIVSSSWDGSIKIWNAQSGQLLHTSIGHTSIGHTFFFVNSVAFSPDNMKIVSGDDYRIKIWDAHSGQLLQTLIGQNAGHSVDGREATGHTDSVSSVAYSSDGLRIVSGSWDSTIKIWDALTGHLLNTWKGHNGLTNSVAFSNPITYPIDAKLKEWGNLSILSG
jgi:hypothetical protein